MSFDKDNKEKKEEENLAEDKNIEYTYEENLDSPVKTTISKKIISEDFDNLKNINEGQNIVTKTIERKLEIPYGKKTVEYKYVSNPVKRYKTHEEIIEYGNEGIPFAKDDLNDLSDGKDQKNEVIIERYEITNDNNDDNNNVNRIYKKNMIKSSGINKRSKFKYESMPANTTTKTIKTTTIIKKTEEGDNENGSNVKIEKKVFIDNNNNNNSNEINSNFSNSLDFSNRLDASDMNESMIRKIKSFVSQHSFSSDKNDEILSSVDFEIKRNKTLREYKDVSPFPEAKEEDEKDDNEEEGTKSKTNVEYLLNNIPILNEDEFKDLKLEIKPILNKYEKYYNDIFNKQDSKEEITHYKNEVISTTKRDKAFDISQSGSIEIKKKMKDILESENEDNEDNEDNRRRKKRKKRIIESEDEVEEENETEEIVENENLSFDFTNIDFIENEPLVNIIDEDKIYSDIELYSIQSKMKNKRVITEVETKTMTEVQKRKRKSDKEHIKEAANQKILNLFLKHDKSENENEDEEQVEVEEEENNNIRKNNKKRRCRRGRRRRKRK